MATNGSFSQQDQYKSATEQYPATSGPTESNTGSASGNSDLSKDEVGWYFVEQYYTTLSKSPEKLHVSSENPIFQRTFLIMPSSSTANVPSLYLVSRLRWLLFPLAVQ